MDILYNTNNILNENVNNAIEYYNTHVKNKYKINKSDLYQNR